MEIEVVVRQQDGRQRLVVAGLILFQPEDLRRGVAGQDGIAGQLDQLIGPTELLFRALLSRGGIAPEFGRADDLVFLIQRHETVLLAAHADGFDGVLALPEFLQDSADRGVHGVEPLLRFLLEMAGRQALDKPVALGRRGQDLAGIEIERDRFGALRTTVDTERDHGFRLQISDFGLKSNRHPGNREAKSESHKPKTENFSWSKSSSTPATA